MTGKQVNVIGAGGHAKVVVRALLEQGYSVRAIFDDSPQKWGTLVLGCPVCGPVERIEKQRAFLAVIAVGDNTLRRSLAERYQLRWATIVHPSALVDPTVELEAGAVILHRAVIQPDCRIGAHAIVNTAATVDHDCIVGDFAHLAPGTHLAGAVSVGAQVLLGIGAVVVPGRTIGHATRVGAGAVVTSDLPPGVVAHGIPARVSRPIPMESTAVKSREPAWLTTRIA